jgi:hypothetical protein
MLLQCGPSHQVKSGPTVSARRCLWDNHQQGEIDRDKEEWRPGLGKVAHDRLTDTGAPSGDGRHIARQITVGCDHPLLRTSSEYEFGGT